MARKKPEKGLDYNALTEDAAEEFTSFNAERALLGRRKDGLTVVKQCGKWIAEGRLPPEGPIRDYFVRFCERIGEGASLSKALGNKPRNIYDNFFRDVLIAHEVDKLWLFGNIPDETITLDKAVEIMIKTYEPYRTLSPSRIKSIFKKYKATYDLRDFHDQMIMDRVTQRIQEKKEAVDDAFLCVEAELNPRCKYSDVNLLKEYYKTHVKSA